MPPDLGCNGGCRDYKERRQRRLAGRRAVGEPEDVRRRAALVARQVVEARDRQVRVVADPVLDERQLRLRIATTVVREVRLGRADEDVQLARVLDRVTDRVVGDQPDVGAALAYELPMVVLYLTFTYQVRRTLSARRSS